MKEERCRLTGYEIEGEEQQASIEPGLVMVRLSHGLEIEIHVWMGENEKRDALVGESEIVAFNLGESGLWGRVVVSDLGKMKLMNEIGF
jgi:hypothetical protein